MAFVKLKRYDGYFINESGIVIDKNKNKLRYSVDDRVGLMYYTINGEIEYINNLVAETFLQNPHNYEFVDFIDKDPLNNHVTNLKYSDSQHIQQYREKRIYKPAYKSKYIYEVYNDQNCIQCVGRGEVAKLIEYEEISLKNMVGNGRIISKGPYTGYQIRRLNIKGDNN